MNRYKWRLLFIFLLIVISLGFLGAKKRTSRTELEYRVEQLEKQNAELHRQVADLNTKLEMLQIRLNTNAQPASGAQSRSAQATGRTATGANPPANVPNNLEVIKISPEYEKKQNQEQSPWTPKIKHYISNSPAPSTSKNTDRGSREVEKIKEEFKSSEKQPSQVNTGQVIVVSSEAEAEALKQGRLKNGEGRLIIVRNEENQEKAQPETAAQGSAARESYGEENNAAPRENYPSAEVDEAVFEIYQEALRLYEEKQYQEAKSKLEKFISTYPESNYLDNAYYWLGECYFDEQDYDKAIDLFSKVTKIYQHSNKAADALYKIGICHLRENRVEKGIDTLEEVRLLYPYSDAAKLAEEKIKEVSD